MGKESCSSVEQAFLGREKIQAPQKTAWEAMDGMLVHERVILAIQYMYVAGTHLFTRVKKDKVE